MKITYLAIALFVLTAIPAFSQTRQRYFDNFDTSASVNVVQVQRQNFVPVAAKNAGIASKNKPLMAPPQLAAGNRASVKLNRKTAQSSPMNAAEGFAGRDQRSGPANRMLMGTASHMKGFTTGDVVIDSYIVDSSKKYRIDPLLIYSQMHQESAFKLRALSNKGASGLMQLMPATARRLGVTNIYDPKQNIEGGVKYMRMLLDMFGQDVNLALAGYNAGEGAVMKYGRQIPPYNETREYVRRISARYGTISNPSIAARLPQINPIAIARLVKNEVRPLTMEQDAVAIKLPGGRMRLVNQ